MIVYYSPSNNGLELRGTRSQVLGLAKGLLNDGSRINCEPAKPFHDYIILERILVEVQNEGLIIISVEGRDVRVRGGTDNLASLSGMVETFAKEWIPPHEFHYEYYDGHQVVGKHSASIVIDICGE